MLHHLAGYWATVISVLFPIDRENSHELVVNLVPSKQRTDSGPDIPTIPCIPVFVIGVVTILGEVSSKHIDNVVGGHKYQCAKVISRQVRFGSHIENVNNVL